MERPSQASKRNGLTSAWKNRKRGLLFRNRLMNFTYSNLRVRFALCAAFLGLGILQLSAAVIPVSDSGALQRAINTAPEGSIVELAAGTYNAPSGGFTLYNPTTSFTVRAAAGAAVT